jgi:hypothetical protein
MALILNHIITGSLGGEHRKGGREQPDTRLVMSQRQLGKPAGREARVAPRDEFYLHGASAVPLQAHRDLVIGEGKLEP